jgi:tRNA(fMet)-specific endonuclease VapC
VTYLLDTNICIYLINKRPMSVVEHIQSLPIEDIGISTVTVAELEYGVAKSLRPEENRNALIEFLTPFRIVEFGQVAAYEYGQLRSVLELQGQIIGPMDLLIAAHALAEGAVLVTNNEKEFRRVPDLPLANWV